jgi:hypothetical protein
VRVFLVAGDRTATSTARLKQNTVTISVPYQMTSRYISVPT